MERFKYLLRHRARALVAFTKAQKRLEKANNLIVEAADECRRNINEHKDEIEARSAKIEAETRAISYLNEEARTNIATINKIQAITG